MIENIKKLKTNNFYIIKSCCDLIVPKEEIGSESIFVEYPFLIDYSIKSHPHSHSFSILLDIKINRDNNMPGYSIFLEAMADFTIEDKNNLSEKDRDYFINYLALEKCIEYSRGFVASLTANYPLGKYYFEAINMGELYNEHLERVKKIKHKNK